MSNIGENGQDIVIIPETDTFAVFTDKTKIEPYLQKVREAIDAFTGDVSTAAGRKAVASMAYRVAKIKTYIEGIGKDLAAEQKKIPARIDATRKYARETLEGWAAEVRAPLTEWEETEAARIKRHTDTLTLLDTFSRGEYPQTVEAIKANIETVSTIIIGPACEEFESDYASAKAKAVSALTATLAKAVKDDDDRKELQALRAEAIKRAAADRDAELVLQAVATAKKAAEDAAQAELGKVALQAKLAQEAAQRREDDLIAANAKAIQDAKDTEARLAREAKAKADEEQRQKLAREADTKHRSAVNRAALAALVEGGIEEETAKKVIALIAKKIIPAVTISY